MKRCLVVDDSAMMRRIVTRTLSALGFASDEVAEAVDGPQALQSAEELADDLALILLDWNLPQIDGLEVLRRLRRTDALRETPVVMVTSMSSEEDGQLAKESGATAMVVKPFRPDELSDVLRRILASESNPA